MVLINFQDMSALLEGGRRSERGLNLASPTKVARVLAFS